MSILAQFSTDNDPGSEAICWATGGEFSHVDVIVPGGLLGARMKGGVMVRALNYKTFTKKAIVSVDVPNEAAARAFLYAQIGKPYNTEAIIDMIFHRQRNFFLEQPKWFCDELLYSAVEEGGVMLLSTANPLTLTPWEVFLSPYWKPVPQETP